ncbi:helix-turn-helix domain-containing protein [Streptomyces sp. NPDC059009]|uniref:helix-turn-helix domain-containing protein n=1 Tax=Streptomyces sp. NPDC059009 TaxID=3346694 RepID=UPI00369A1259
MTPKGQGGLPCPNPGCPNTVDQVHGSGRPRQYCSESCGKAYRKMRSKLPPETAAHDDYAIQVAEDLAHKAQLLVRLVRDAGTLEALSLLVEVRVDIEDIEAAIVQQARDRKKTGTEIAQALHVGTDKVSRKLSSDATARSRQRRLDRTPPAAPAPPQAPTTPTAPAPPIPRQRTPRPPSTPRDPGTDKDTAGPPADGPAAALSRALSHLQRTSGKTLTALGGEAGVSTSYISRILSGERVPSWPVTRTIVSSCGRDPAIVRPLWDAARGIQAPGPSTLNAALRGLLLAACTPSYARIRARTHNALTLEEIHAVIDQAQVPEHFDTVGHLVSALDGQPETFRPLWNAARQTPTHHHAHPAWASALPAGAFG